MPEPTARRLANAAIVLAAIGLVVGCGLARFTCCISTPYSPVFGLLALMPATMAWRMRDSGTGLRENPRIAVAGVLIVLAVVAPFGLAPFLAPDS